MINVNDYQSLTDSETIENAIRSKQEDGIILIPPRVSDIEPERSCWLIDRAILLPADTTVILQNCVIKLSDKCRDNFFRTANCGMNIISPEKISNVHIRGEGLCILRGAEHPRATGDGTKILADPCPYEVGDLCRMAEWIPSERRTPETIGFMDRHDHSFGTDAGKPGESQYGDWRSVGILFAAASCFSVCNLRIEDSHGWGLSFEDCSNGRVEKITFDACMSKQIDGMRNNIENQDGVDIRNGCHDIIISDITGKTGDDVIALTAIADEKYHPGGSLNTTHVMHNDWSKRDRNIYNIIIRNVIAHSDLCYVIRLLPANAKISNVIIDGIIENNPEGHRCNDTINMGDSTYGTNPRDGMTNITISNVICNSENGLVISECLKDSVITNVINRKPGKPVLTVRKENGTDNVKTVNLLTT